MSPNNLQIRTCVKGSLGKTHHNIVQNCHRTNGPRHARHDAVVRMLENRLKEKGYVTKLEPRIPTVLGIRMTDLCAWSRSEYIVCDVEVIKDTFGLDRWHEFKVNKYDKPSLKSWGFWKTHDVTRRLLMWKS